MATRLPMTQLPTHAVTNQPPPLEDINLFELDTALVEGVRREGAAWAEAKIRAFGAETGSAELLQAGELANRHPPELKTFDRYGQRIDSVEFHPAYHRLMRAGLEAGIHSVAWTDHPQGGGHVAHAALEYLLVQTEAGVCCPITMTYAAVPVLRQYPEIGAAWLPKILETRYDERALPAAEKRALTLGMAMTEKQGGSDVRANSTQALPLGGDEYALTGHKWFCSAPMSDAFLTLAQTGGGLTCFLVPRWRPDGARNPFFIQRLKDKLGDRANASAEIEYNDTFALRLGAAGRGVKTIIEMVHHTRLDTCLAAAGLMRQAFVQAAHHANHRRAFGRRLIEQPLMRNVLADLALEAEAALLLTLRIARAYDAAANDEAAAAFARVAVAIGKYWVNRNAPHAVYEAMECLGGNGYVEESMLPRLYREAPLNSIWEGSGNVICLDVVRALTGSPETASALLAELEDAAAADARIARTLARVKDLLARPDRIETQARRLVEDLALALQAGLMLRHAPAGAAQAFLASRLADGGGFAYGTLPPDADCSAILRRAWPRLDA